MNKLLLLLLLSTALVFVSCGDKDNEEPQKKDTTTIEQIIPPTVIEDAKETPAAKPDTIATAPKSEIKSADKPVVEKIDKTNNPLTGSVVSINDIAMGGNGVVSSSEAGKVIAKGSILAFKSGNQIYLVYNEDGTFASKKLANYAGKTLKIKGEIKKIDDLQVLIATSIE